MDAKRGEVICGQCLLGTATLAFHLLRDVGAIALRERGQPALEVELLDARIVGGEIIGGAAEFALEGIRSGRERQLRPALGAGEGLDEGARRGCLLQLYCGIGGGELLKMEASSGTSPAFDHPDIPARHTSEPRVSWPDEACCCNEPRSNGPVWFWPTAT